MNLLFKSLVPYVELIRVIGLVLTVILIFSAGWKLRDFQQTESEFKEMTSIIRQRDVLDLQKQALETTVAEQSAQLERQLSSNDREIRYITKTVTKEVEKPVYKDCVVPVSGIESLKEAQRKLNEVRQK